jgi:NAD(P)-dependent dehydrogenase (short-subunit alcohol dehydrogenase family)
MLAVFHDSGRCTSPATGASIVLNGSIAETVGLPGMSAYSASKAGLSAICRSLVGELSTRAIRINVVAPGPIKTPIWTRETHSDSGARIASKMQQAVPLNRLGEAEEVAKVVLFLASDDSSYVNGSEIIVDGGVTGATFGAPIYQS